MEKRLEKLKMEKAEAKKLVEMLEAANKLAKLSNAWMQKMGADLQKFDDNGVPIGNMIELLNVWTTFHR